MSDFKPILAIDFDGVIHSYERGWQHGELYGTVTPGFFHWAERAAELFKLVIYSSRSAHPGMRERMEDWLLQRYENWRNLQRISGPTPTTVDFHFTAEKPPAWLTIDDRTLRFDGHWDAPELEPQALRDFRPWNSHPSTPNSPPIDEPTNPLRTRPRRTGAVESSSSGGS